MPSPPTGGRTPQVEEGEYPQMVQGALGDSLTYPGPGLNRGRIEDGVSEKEEARRDLGQLITEKGRKAT